MYLNPLIPGTDSGFSWYPFGGLGYELECLVLAGWWLYLGKCSGPPVADWSVSAGSMQRQGNAHPWVIGGDEGQPRERCVPGGAGRSHSVSRVVFPIDGPPAATPKGSSVGAIECLTAVPRVRTIVDVKDYGFFGRPQFDMGNVGLIGMEIFWGNHFDLADLRGDET